MAKNNNLKEYNTGGIMSLLEPLKLGLAPMVQEEGKAKLDEFINEVSGMVSERFGEYTAPEQQPLQQPLNPITTPMPMPPMPFPGTGKGGGRPWQRHPQRWKPRRVDMMSNRLQGNPPNMLSGIGSYLGGNL